MLTHTSFTPIPADGTIGACPLCGAPGVGFPGHKVSGSGVLAARGGAPLGITHLWDDTVDPANPGEARGSWIEIPFEGETCDCDLRFVIAFHKGTLITGIAAKAREA